MKLSVIIPAYNEAERLPATLAHISQVLKQTARPDFAWELIVCDNNSSDATAQVAAAAGARVVAEAVNQISRARNTGAAAAQGEWLLFVDADTHPPTGLMAQVLALIEGDQHIGCGSTMQVEGGTRFNKLRLERLNPIMRLFKLGGGAFLLCRADAFRELGGFSTGLYAMEELDFVLRLKRLGRKGERAFAVFHEHPIITSGRKGEYDAASLATLFGSNLAAVIQFLLYYILPRRVSETIGGRFLGYWYQRR